MGYKKIRSEKMAKKRVKLDKLRVGMIVADDVYTERDQLIIHKKSIINERLIAKLKIHRSEERRVGKECN